MSRNSLNWNIEERGSGKNKTSKNYRTTSSRLTHIYLETQKDKEKRIGWNKIEKNKKLISQIFQKQGRINYRPKKLTDFKYDE